MRGVIDGTCSISSFPFATFLACLVGASWTRAHLRFNALMSTLLRKVKSTIYAATMDPRQEAPQTDLSGGWTTGKPLPIVHNHPDTLINRSLIKSTIKLRQNQPDRPLTEFRRRLARKASTFSLRTKRWKEEVKERHQQERKSQERVKEEEFLGRHHERLRTEYCSNDTADAFEVGQPREARHQKQHDNHSITNSSVVTGCPTTTRKEEGNLSQTDTAKGQGLTKSSAGCGTKGEGCTAKDQDTSNPGGKMASEHAAPPVPYTRLKEITEKVRCGPTLESFLSGCIWY